MTGVHPLECVIPDGVLIQVGPPDDEHLLLETCSGVEINTMKKSASSWSLTRMLTGVFLTPDTLHSLPFHYSTVNFNKKTTRFFKIWSDLNTF